MRAADEAIAGKLDDHFPLYVWQTGSARPSKTLTPGQLTADDRGTLGQRLEFGEGEITRDVFHAAIGGRDQPLRWQVLERRADTGGDDLWCFRLGGRPC